MKTMNLNLENLAGAVLLSRVELKKIMGGNLAEDTLGTPGGDNGNPCYNNGCSAGGGYMVCQDSSGNQVLGNCNNNGNAPGSHNACITNHGANYWC